MNIKNYISKESIFVAGVTAVLATIVTSIIDNKEIKKAEQNVEEARKTIGEAKEAAERLQKTMAEIEAETVELLEENEKLRKENEVTLKELISLKETVKNYRTLEKVNELAEEAINETDDNIEESKKIQSEFDQVFGLENLYK